MYNTSFKQLEIENDTKQLPGIGEFADGNRTYWSFLPTISRDHVSYVSFWTCTRGACYPRSVESENAPTPVSISRTKWRISIMIHATVISPGDPGSINRAAWWSSCIAAHSINNATRSFTIRKIFSPMNYDPPTSPSIVSFRFLTFLLFSSFCFFFSFLNRTIISRLMGLFIRFDFCWGKVLPRENYYDTMSRRRREGSS